MFLVVPRWPFLSLIYFSHQFWADQLFLHPDDKLKLHTISIASFKALAWKLEGWDAMKLGSEKAEKSGSSKAFKPSSFPASQLWAFLTCRFPPWTVVLEPWAVIFRHDSPKWSFNRETVADTRRQKQILISHRQTRTSTDWIKNYLATDSCK